MKKRFLLLLISSWSLFVHAQKNIYEHVQFNQLSKNHKTLAIIPFLSQVKLNAKVDENTRHQIENSEGTAVQNALETYFLKQKNRKKLTISIQNIEKTNTLLSKNHIDRNNMDIYTTEELCKLLGVDAMISGTISLNVRLSKGIQENEFSLVDYVVGKSFGRINMKISDGATGKLLWKYEKDIDRKTGKNTNDLIESMMRQASRKFPYEKD